MYGTCWAIFWRSVCLFFLSAVMVMSIELGIRDSIGFAIIGLMFFIIPLLVLSAICTPIAEILNDSFSSIQCAFIVGGVVGAGFLLFFAFSNQVEFSHFNQTEIATILLAIIDSAIVAWSVNERLEDN